MDNIFYDPEAKPSGLAPKAMLMFTSAFSRLAPNLSGRFALKYLFKPYSRREYSFRTQTQPKNFRIESIKGQVALYHFKAKSDKHILLSHGWADTSVRFTYLIDHLVEQGFNVWTLDQIGHGKSDGDTSHLLGFVDGIKESIQFIESKNHNLIALLGHSMGGLAVLNQQDLNNKKVILMSAPTKFFENLFTNTKKFGVANKMLLEALEHVSKKYNTNWKQFSPDKLVHKINKNFLIIHDEKDPTCSYENFKNLVKNTEHEFVTTQGLGHLKLLKDAQVLKRISNFLLSD